jgi:hypothetical protein
MARQWITVDGNDACASVAYRLSDVIAIYTITPSSSMAEAADAWAALQRPSLWGTVPSVVEMQSEAGAAGTEHWALQGGGLATRADRCREGDHGGRQRRAGRVGALQRGPVCLHQIVTGFEQWADEHEYESLVQNARQLEPGALSGPGLVRTRQLRADSPVLAPRTHRVGAVFSGG